MVNKKIKNNLIIIIMALATGLGCSVLFEIFKVNIYIMFGSLIFVNFYLRFVEL